MTDAELLAEIAALESVEDRAALGDPASVLRRIMPGYRLRPHLMVITRAMARVLTGEIDRLLITVPPQTGKTVTAVVGGAVWWLANRPTARVVVGSYGDSLAIERGRESLGLVRDYGHRYGLELARGAKTVKNWRLTSGGGVRSVGVGAGITGHPADIVFVDDPHKSREEADSLRARDRVYRWLSADIVSRMSPRAPLVMIMTPWHPDDLRARVIADEGTLGEGGRWLVIRMPALCDDPEHDPLGRAAGEPLPHPRIPVLDVAAALAHWHDKRRASTTQDWHALYMLDPRPVEGALVTRELMRERRCYSVGSPCHPCDMVPVRSAVAVDPSGGGRDVAGIVGGYLGSDKRLYISHDVSGVMPSDEWSRQACVLAADIDADLIIVEKNFGGDLATLAVRTAWKALQREESDAAASEIWALVESGVLTAEQAENRRRRWRGRFGLCPRVRAVVARKNKRLRAEPIAQQIKEDRVRLAAYLPEVEEEWATWQAGSADSPGRIDASVYLAHALLPLPSAGGTGGSAPPRGSMPTTGSSPLDTGGGPSGFGALG